MADPSPSVQLTRGAALLVEGTRPPPPRSGLTQADVAAELGVHRSLVSHWATGVSRPTLDHAVRLSALLQIPVEAWTEPAPDEPAATALTPPHSGHA